MFDCQRADICHHTKGKSSLFNDSIVKVTFQAKSLVAQLVGTFWCSPKETSRVQIPPTHNYRIIKGH